MAIQQNGIGNAVKEDARERLKGNIKVLLEVSGHEFKVKLTNIDVCFYFSLYSPVGVALECWKGMAEGWQTKIIRGEEEHRNLEP